MTNKKYIKIRGAHPVRGGIIYESFFIPQYLVDKLEKLRDTGKEIKGMDEVFTEIINNVPTNLVSNE